MELREPAHRRDRMRLIAFLFPTTERAPSYKRERLKLVIPFLLPAVVLYTLLFTYPVLQAPYISLTKYDGWTDPVYVGLANYQALIGDDRWWNAVRNTLLFAAMSIFAGLSLGLFFAVAMTQIRRGLRAIKFVVFLPSILPGAVVALLWMMIYNPGFGLLNGTLRAIGLPGLAHAWLGENELILPSIVVAGLWSGIGGTMILFLAGLQKIPRDYYDAARIDGANPLQEFIHITWPLLWEVTRLLIILAVIGGLQAFGLFYIISGGWVREAAQVTGTYLFIAGFKEGKMGYATAIGIVLFVVIMVLTVVTNRLLQRETVEF